MVCFIFAAEPGVVLDELDHDLERGEVTLKVIYRDWPLWRCLIWQNARASRGKVRLLQITVSCDAGDLFALVWRSFPGVDIRQAGTPLKFKSVAPAGANELTCSVCCENLNGEGTGLLALASLPCGDSFHVGCVTTWAQSGSANCRACPLCRCPY